MYKRKLQVTSRRVEPDGWVRVFTWGRSGPGSFLVPGDDQFYEVGETYLETRQGHGFCHTEKLNNQGGKKDEETKATKQSKLLAAHPSAGRDGERVSKPG